MAFTKNIDKLVDMFNTQKINLTRYVKKTLKKASILLKKNKRKK